MEITKETLQAEINRINRNVQREYKDIREIGKRIVENITDNMQPEAMGFFDYGDAIKQHETRIARMVERREAFQDILNNL